MIILNNDKKEPSSSAFQGLTLKNPWYLLATGFGSGLSPFFPGTIGSLVAIPLWYLLSFLPLKLYCFWILLALGLGVYLCEYVEKQIGVHDHGSVVWDEFLGIWITLMFVPLMTWQWVLIGFVIFRFFDIWKPWPIRWFDRQVKGGAGIMLDDVIAGIISGAFLWFLGILV